MTQKRERPQRRTGGAEIVGSESHDHYTSAWQRFARIADISRLSARQAVAVCLLQSGIASTPEQALKLLEVR